MPRKEKTEWGEEKSGKREREREKETTAQSF
jgi:hypothetical protein